MHLREALQIRNSVSSILAARFMTLLFKTRAHGQKPQCKINGADGYRLLLARLSRGLLA